MELLLVELRPVKENALFKGAVKQHLHFNIELPAGLVTRLDIENRQFVVQKFLGIEGIEQLNRLDFMSRWRTKHLVNHVNEDRNCAFPSEKMLECIIYCRVNAKIHRS